MWCGNQLLEMECPHLGIIPSMSYLDFHIKKFVSRNPDETRRIGAYLGASLQTGDVICLQGDLGAGKTTFVQGVAHGWGSLDSVSSPTFVIVNEYRRADQGILFHMDAYRLGSAVEAEQLDFDTMLTDGALLIEWPERIDGLVPNERLWINLEHAGEEERDMKFKSTGKRYGDLIKIIDETLAGAV